MFMQFLVHLFHCCFLLIESIRCCVSCKSREASGEADRSNVFFHLDVIIILIFIKDSLGCPSGLLQFAQT